MEGGSALVEGKMGSSVAGTNVPVYSKREALDRTVDGFVLGSPLPVDMENNFWIDSIITGDSDFCFFRGFVPKTTYRSLLRTGLLSFGEEPCV